MGPYDDFDIYKCEYKWWMEQMDLGTTEKNREPGRDDRESCHDAHLQQCYWLKRDDGVFAPVP